MARKTFVVTFLSICLMMAIPSGWAALEGASESPQNNTTVKGDAGYVEEFTGETIEAVLDSLFKRPVPSPVPQSDGFVLPKGNITPPAEGLKGMTLQTNSDLGDPTVGAAVPEPGTLMLLGSGILGLAVLGRRKLHK